MKNIKKIIASNLLELRKEYKLTQSELAEKLNYSDKSISKWEKGETLPDIEILCKIAQIYGVSFDYLIHEGKKSEKRQYIKSDTLNKIFISLLAVSFVWILASIIFVYINLNANLGTNTWLAFIWSIPNSFLVLIILNKFLKYKGVLVYYFSFFIWSLLLSVYLQFLSYNIWLIFILGIPIQATILLWARIFNNRNSRL